jgi:hypothetical protein
MKRLFASFAAILGIAFFGTVMIASAAAQTTPAPPANPHFHYNIQTPETTLSHYPWEFGPFLQGGFGTANRSDFHFLAAGVKLGKILTHPALPGLLRGRFEYDIEVMPYWQAFTPKAGLQAYPVTNSSGQQIGNQFLPTGGGTFTGISITPILLRWDLMPHGHWEPWVQGGGGLIYTTHKFPPDVLVPHGTPGGTSVFNFTPQFGIGAHYFISPRRSIYVEANAVHISSSSLGDKNPGVNASVQFQLGYSWWWSRKR